MFEAYNLNVVICVYHNIYMCFLMCQETAFVWLPQQDGSQLHKMSKAV